MLQTSAIDVPIIVRSDEILTYVARKWKKRPGDEEDRENC